MLEVAVMADDLTGAADTGVHFRRFLDQVRLVSADDLSELTAAGPLEGGVSIYTTSRALPPEAAREKVRAAAEALKGQHPKIVYKKVDSTLRGNIGAEADALIQALGLAGSFIAPAHPAVGRTTVSDIHLVLGAPVAETEIGRDPVSPVRDSRLSAVIAGQSRHLVASVTLAELKGDAAGLAGRIEAFLAEGLRHFTFDVGEPADLDRIVLLARTRFPRMLLVGSAGLAGALSAALSQGAALPRPSLGSGPGRLLYVLGTVSAVGRRQMEALQAAFGLPAAVLDPADLAGEEASPALAGQVEKLAEQLLSSDLILRPARPEESPGRIIPPALVARGLGRVVARLARLTRPGGLYLTGGDTALAALEALGGLGLSIDAELSTGLVLGRLEGGSLAGLPLATKPGAFGADQALKELHRYWLRHKEKD